MKATHFIAVQITIVLVLIGAFFGHSNDAAAKPAKTGVQKVSDSSKIEGAWKMTAYKYRDAAEFTNLAKEEQTRFKFITGGKFIWVVYDPKTMDIEASAGGKYVLNGSKYTETPEYGYGPDSKAMRNKEQSFTVHLDGEKLRQTGILHFGGEKPEEMKLEEVWVRVKE